MKNDDDDESVLKYQERVNAVTKLFQRAPHNLIEEVEKLGFTYTVDEDEDAEEIAEERIAQPVTPRQIKLVSYLEGSCVPDASVLALWQEEIQSDGTPTALWRRYFRAGNVQLKKLILCGLGHRPTDPVLLDQLSFLHFFVPMHKELLAHYLRACDEELDVERFKNLARDFDESAESFGYNALQALRDRYAESVIKRRVVDNLLAEKSHNEQTIVAF